MVEEKVKDEIEKIKLLINVINQYLLRKRLYNEEIKQEVINNLILSLETLKYINVSSAIKKLMDHEIEETVKDLINIIKNQM